MAKLGDVCTIVSGTTPKTSVPEYWDGTLNWITPAELNEDTFIINESQRKITEEGAKSCGLTPFPAGTVILSSRAPIGKTAIAGTEMYCNQGFKNLICSDVIFNQYLFWFLRGNTEYLNSLGRGATFKEISKKIVQGIEIPLPSIERQKEVASVLDKVSSLISLRKQQLEKLDELVKARFVEMFGDNRTNEKGFDVRKGTTLFKFSSGKFLPANQRLDDGIPVYGGNGIAWYTNEAMINYPTIIIGRVGAQCGNIHLVNEPVWITDNAIYIKEQKTDCYDLRFLSILMDNLNYYQYADFSGQPKITQKPLETLDYIVPPLALQREYTSIVSQIENSKTTIQHSLNKLETLKKALMQEYFG